MVQSPKAVPTRQNHYANVCALRRQRSSVSNRSVECLTAILHRRAASVEFPNHTQKVLNRTLSQPIDSMKLRKLNSPSLDSNDEVFSSPLHHSIKEEFLLSSPEDEDDGSPTKSSRKIKNLKEFRNLTCSSNKSPQKTLNNKVSSTTNSETAIKNDDKEVNFSRRCLSDSDAVMPSVALEENDSTEIWTNPISSSYSTAEESEEGDEIRLELDTKNEDSLIIVAQEERPSKMKLKETTDNSVAETLSSLNSCEEVSESGCTWQVSVTANNVGGEVTSSCPPPTSLPPPTEFAGGNPFLMFLCVTILLQHRNFIMQQNMDHNELAMHFDKMVRKHNVHKVLCQARKMFEAYLQYDFKDISKTTPNSSNSTQIDQSC